MELKFFYKIDMSINKMYWTNFQQRGMKFLTREAKNLRAKIMESTINQIKEKEFNRQDVLEINIDFYEDWYFKNGNIKKIDLDNRLKFLIDSICFALDIDDSQIFSIKCNKIQSPLEHTFVSFNKKQNEA